MSELAVCNDVSKQMITSYASNTLQVITQVDNLADALNSSEFSQVGRALAGYVSNAVTLKYQQSFHDSLSVLEKCNFISQTKRIKYERTSGLVKSGTYFAIEMIAVAAPILAGCISDSVSKSNLQNFFISWIAYINDNNRTSDMVLSNIRKIWQAMSLDYDETKVKTALSESNVRTMLNSRNKKMLDQTEKEQLLSLSKLVITTADLENSEIRDRALEFLSDILDVPFSEAQYKINDVVAAQEHLRQLLMFSAIDYTVYFKKFISSMSEAENFGKYDVSLDPYARLRNRNMENVSKLVRTSFEIGKNTQQNITNMLKGKKPSNPNANKPLFADIYRIGNEILSDTLIPPNDKVMDFIDAKIARNESYNITEDEDEQHIK